MVHGYDGNLSLADTEREALKLATSLPMMSRILFDARLFVYIKRVTKSLTRFRAVLKLTFNYTFQKVEMDVMSFTMDKHFNIISITK